MQDLISYLDVKVRALLKEYKTLKEENDILSLEIEDLRKRLGDQKTASQDVILATMIAEDLAKEISDFEECDNSGDALTGCAKLSLQEIEEGELQ